MIGNRLKLARSAAGLSRSELRAKTGNRLTERMIEKLERNEVMTDLRGLMDLASALGVAEEFLIGNQEMTLEAVEFRKNCAARKRDEARVEMETLDFLERCLTLEGLLRTPSGEWSKSGEDPYPVRGNLDGAERAAENLRDDWRLGGDPIPNLVELLEGRGIKVLSIDLTNIHGMTARVRAPDGGTVPVIVVKKERRGERQRFALSRELGHLVMDVDKESVDEEKAANRFAGAFLMPAEDIRRQVGDHRASIPIKELFDLKRRHGVSVQAITNRCKELGIFGQPLFNRLFMEFGHRGWLNPPYAEPNGIEIEILSRFERLVFRALAEGEISDSKAAEFLRVPIHAIDGMMYGPVQVTCPQIYPHSEPDHVLPLASARAAEPPPVEATTGADTSGAISRHDR